jgi:hypothetical protein
MITLMNDEVCDNVKVVYYDRKHIGYFVLNDASWVFQPLSTKITWNSSEIGELDLALVNLNIELLNEKVNDIAERIK